MAYSQRGNKVVEYGFLYKCITTAGSGASNQFYTGAGGGVGSLPGSIHEIIVSSGNFDDAISITTDFPVFDNQAFFSFPIPAVLQFNLDIGYNLLGQIVSNSSAPATYTVTYL